jgi:hypothetical protein
VIKKGRKPRFVKIHDDFLSRARFWLFEEQNICIQLCKSALFSERFNVLTVTLINSSSTFGMLLRVNCNAVTNVLEKRGVFIVRLKKSKKSDPENRVLTLIRNSGSYH